MANNNNTKLYETKRQDIHSAAGATEATTMLSHIPIYFFSIRFCSKATVRKHLEKSTRRGWRRKQSLCSFVRLLYVSGMGIIFRCVGSILFGRLSFIVVCLPHQFPLATRHPHLRHFNAAGIGELKMSERVHHKYE